jgi:DNA-directed RNA polymerase specialized sigma24 family protein
MEITKRRTHCPQRALDSASVLEEYYGQLQKWGLVLTRGDRAIAEEIVHDLCLYFSMTKPDLGQVANLDGYLYTCLRHIYLSALSRSTREALQTIHIADFDSVQFALNMRMCDSLLERQNELRRICNYAVWRKDSSKSASCFILHFFHGYARREIAEIACLPIAAIYNKLKVARDEVKSHLEVSSKMRVATRETPPDPELLRSPAPSLELFDDLEQMIFEAKDSGCLSEEALLEHYQTVPPMPIPCNLLSHIVSCKRCLSVIDHHFDRHSGEDQGPPDGIRSSMDRKSTSSIAQDGKSFRTLMRAVEWQRDKVCDHRPRTLSIAVDGKITAFHDVQSERSTLAARIDHPRAAQFIEVFTDQQIRLAMLPVGEYPPEGSNSQTQLVSLTDNRWLELTLSFDGLGLHSEVTYFDPTLADRMVEEEIDEESLFVEARGKAALRPAPSTEPKAESVFAQIARTFREMAPQFALAWTVMVVVILGGSGYLMYRHHNPGLETANEALNRSIQLEMAGLKGETEHQILRLGASGADGHALWHGTVDVWKENDTGRTMRRLYDAHQRLIASAWHGEDGQNGSSVEANREDLSDADHEIAESALWQQDVSSRAFHDVTSSHVQIRAVGEEYELVSYGIADGFPHLVSATLVLDRHLRVKGETLRVSDGSPIKEVDFVQTDYERRPSASVPAKVFEPADLDNESTGDQRLSAPGGQNSFAPSSSNVQQVELQIAVLYELNELGADTGEPIEVTRTSDGHIRISGTVADESRKREISTGLETLPGHKLLDIRLAAQGDLRVPSSATRWGTAPVTNVYSVTQSEAPADTLLQKYFAGKGWTGERAKSAAAQFSQDALRHSQRALQHAYALARLGNSFTGAELQSVGQNSDRQWAEMTARHVTVLENELRELREQLCQVEPTNSQLVASGGRSVQMDTPQDFAVAARGLLRQTQNLNRGIGKAFTAGPTGNEAPDADSQIIESIHLIPTQDAARMAAFATRLANSENAAISKTKRAGKE